MLRRSMCGVFDLETKLLGDSQAVLILILMVGIHRSESVLFLGVSDLLDALREGFVCHVFISI